MSTTLVQNPSKGGLPYLSIKKLFMEWSWWVLYCVRTSHCLATLPYITCSHPIPTWILYACFNSVGQSTCVCSSGALQSNTVWSPVQNTCLNPCAVPSPIAWRSRFKPFSRKSRACLFWQRKRCLLSSVFPHKQHFLSLFLPVRYCLLLVANHPWMYLVTVTVRTRESRCNFLRWAVQHIASQLAMDQSYFVSK